MSQRFFYGGYVKQIQANQDQPTDNEPLTNEQMKVSTAIGRMLAELYQPIIFEPKIPSESRRDSRVNDRE